MPNEELTLTAGDGHAAAQNAYSIRQAKPEDLPIAYPLVAEYFREIDVTIRARLVPNLSRNNSAEKKSGITEICFR